MARRRVDACVEVHEELGRRIRARRVELRMSQSDMCRRTGIDWSYVGKIERGRTNPTLATVLIFAQALEMDLVELVAGLGLPAAG